MTTRGGSPRQPARRGLAATRLVRCGACDTCLNSHKLGRNSDGGKVHRYYTCRNKARSDVPGQQLCPERSVRVDVLDAFVFGQVKAALMSPAALCAW